mgnify:CR=1 FL=1
MMPHKYEAAMDGLGVVVMAAGRGTRMRSEQAKVLHRIVGRPMIDRKSIRLNSSHVALSRMPSSA